MNSMSRKTMIISFLFLMIFSSVQILALAKKSDSELDSKILAKVGPEKITYGSLQKAFRKNMNRGEIDLKAVPKDSVMNFLDLYVKYRLKVLDAVDRGFDKDSAVIADIEQNRMILAESFYYEKELVEPNVNRFLEMRKHELQIAIILVAFDNSKPNPDTTEQYKKATDALKQIQSGESFGKIAAKVSDDKQSAKNNGVVGAFLTAGKVQRPIENAMYSLENDGDVYPELIHTRYGYFIVKLIRKVPRIQIKGRHILFSDGYDKDSSLALARADSVIALLKNGADFVQMAEENSDDPSSAMAGGYLGSWYSRSSAFGKKGAHLTAPIEDALFELKDGEISGRVISDYGVHILKRDSTRNFDVENDRDELKKMYKRLYKEADKAELLEKLRKKYNFEIIKNVFDALVGFIDTTKTSIHEDWDKDLPAELLDKPIFKILNEEMLVQEFAEAIKSKPEMRGLNLNVSGFNKGIIRLADPIAFKEATKSLEADYPDFEMLMKEFRDGILLFRVEAIEVWDNLKFDSTLAKEYYESTKSEYHTDPTYNISEIYVLNDTLANSIYKQIQDGKEFDAMAEQYTQREGFREKKGTWGLVTTDKNELAKKAEEKKMEIGNVSEPFKYEKGYSIIKLVNFQPVRPKTFEEAISDFAPDFQDHMQKKLTENWLNKVKKKFPVKIDKKNIKKIFN